jgi:hypothetical protein
MTTEPAKPLCIQVLIVIQTKGNDHKCQEKNPIFFLAGSGAVPLPSPPPKELVHLCL